MAESFNTTQDTSSTNPFCDTDPADVHLMFDDEHAAPGDSPARIIWHAKQGRLHDEAPSGTASEAMNPFVAKIDTGLSERGVPTTTLEPSHVLFRAQREFDFLKAQGVAEQRLEGCPISAITMNENAELFLSLQIVPGGQITVFAEADFIGRYSASLTRGDQSMDSRLKHHLVEQALTSETLQEVLDRFGSPNANWFRLSSIGDYAAVIATERNELELVSV